MTTQRLGVVTVPTLDQLLDDAVFLRYMRARPRLPLAAQHGEPWLLVAKRHSDDTRAPWAIKGYADYLPAFDRACDIIDRGQFHDVTIVSKRRYMQPPVGFVWDMPLGWCSRCRRPSQFKELGRHPGIHTGSAKGIVPSVLRRCVLCGVPEGFAPTYGPRFDNDGR